jgi:putative CRISPR-associated protein (TIGR02619 family)
MSRLILNTVGTSLLRNRSRTEGAAPPTDPELLDLLRTNPVGASAESNALSRISEPGDEAVFLHSDTEDGLRCAQMLGAYFEKQGLKVRLERVAGLGYDEGGFVNHGLRNFTRLLGRELREAQRRGQPALINATGGFKAQITYATVLGLVFNTPVCYIHENFRDVVTLPATPIGWDYSLFAWYSDFFDWLDAEPRPTHEVTNRAAALPAEVLTLLDDAPDGCTYLSPLGEAYLEAFRAAEANDHAPRLPLLLSKSVRRTLAGLTESLQAEAAQVLRRLRLGTTGDWRRKAEKVSGGDAYKFPKGRGVVRVFFVEREGKLYALEIAGHMNEREYNRWLTEGVDSSDYPADEFVDEDEVKDEDE